MSDRLVLTNEQHYEAIAAAIREKLGGTDTYLPGQMPAAIRAIGGGGYPEPTGSVTITENGTHNVKDYAEAVVNVQGGYPEPTGSVTITQNGTHNVKDYAEAAVNVPNTYGAGDEGKVVSGGALVQQTARTVTANGTYDTTTNSAVTVNVAAPWTVSEHDNVIAFAGSAVSEQGNTISLTT